MKTLRERYLSDPQFNLLVDTIVNSINNGNFTPSEIMEAAILASIIYEEHNINRMRFVERDVEEALRTIRNRVLSESDLEGEGPTGNRLRIGIDRRS